MFIGGIWVENTWPGRIRQEMEGMAAEYFRVESLRRLALSFLEAKAKESMPFGKLTVIHYRMFGGNMDCVYRAAAAVELLILALDIFDDLQDQDNPSALWSLIPSPTAMNIAIGFLGLAQQTVFTLSEDPVRVAKAAEYLNRQLLQAVNGQMLDLQNEIVTEEDYLAMVEQKSGALLECACMVGTLLAKGEEDPVVVLYARQIGIAAQIKNDIADCSNWNRKNDFVQRKKTLPVLYVLQSDLADGTWLKDYFARNGEAAEILEKKQEIEDILENTGAALYATVMMRTYYYRSLELFDLLPVEEEWKDRLIACCV